MHYQTLFKWIFMVCLVILTYLLLIEMTPSPDASIYKDKLQHAVAFAGLAFWGLLAYQSRTHSILMGLAVFGALMEVLQGILTTTRQSSFYDWLADIVGLVLAWLLVRFVLHRRLRV